MARWIQSCPVKLPFLSWFVMVGPPNGVILGSCIRNPPNVAESCQAGSDTARNQVLFETPSDQYAGSSARMKMLSPRSVARLEGGRCLTILGLCPALTAIATPVRPGIALGESMAPGFHSAKSSSCARPETSPISGGVMLSSLASTARPT